MEEKSEEKKGRGERERERFESHSSNCSGERRKRCVLDYLLGSQVAAPPSFRGFWLFQMMLNKYAVLSHKH